MSFRLSRMWSDLVTEATDNPCTPSLSKAARFFAEMSSSWLEASEQGETDIDLIDTHAVENILRTCNEGRREAILRTGGDTYQGMPLTEFLKVVETTDLEFIAEAPGVSAGTVMFFGLRRNAVLLRVEVDGGMTGLVDCMCAVSGEDIERMMNRSGFPWAASEPVALRTVRVSNALVLNLRVLENQGMRCLTRWSLESLVQLRNALLTGPEIRSSSTVGVAAALETRISLIPADWRVPFDLDGASEKMGRALRTPVPAEEIGTA